MEIAPPPPYGPVSVFPINVLVEMVDCIDAAIAPPRVLALLFRNELLVTSRIPDSAPIAPPIVPDAVLLLNTLFLMVACGVLPESIIAPPFPVAVLFRN